MIQKDMEFFMWTFEMFLKQTKYAEYDEFLEYALACRGLFEGTIIEQAQE